MVCCYSHNGSGKYPRSKVGVCWGGGRGLVGRKVMISFIGPTIQLGQKLDKLSGIGCPSSGLKEKQKQAGLKTDNDLFREFKFFNRNCNLKFDFKLGK